MRLMTLLLASVFIAAPALAQKSQSSTNAQGVQIQGNTEIKAKQENASAVAQGEGNTAKNTAGAIRGGTQIQGNTKIKAAQKNVTAVVSGRSNSAGNDAGTIGDAAPVVQTKEPARVCRQCAKGVTNCPC